MFITSLLVVFKWLVSTALMYIVLFIGIGIWTAKLIQVPELKKSLNVVQVFLRLSLCMLPIIIASLTYQYAHFMTGAITPSPKMAEKYREVELMLQPYLSIGLGSLFSGIYLWFFIFKKNDSVQDTVEL